MDKKLYYFIGQAKNPYHLSVGAVLVNEKREICVHHYESADGSKNVYSFMRETVRFDDSLKGAVERGLAKEFGVTATVERYLGSLTSRFTNWENIDIQKTTLYFLCAYKGIVKKENVQEKHFEWVSKETVEWVTYPELLKKMETQSNFTARSDFDEVDILHRAFTQ